MRPPSLARLRLAAERFFAWYKWPKLIKAAAWIGYDWDAAGIPLWIGVEP